MFSCRLCVVKLYPIVPLGKKRSFWLLCGEQTWGEGGSRGTSEEAAAALQASNEGGDRDLKCRVLDVA